jgi:hypothetical protein
VTERGARPTYHDRFVLALKDQGLRSTPLDAQLGADAIVLSALTRALTAPAIVESSRLFVDLRGTTRGTRDDARL